MTEIARLFEHFVCLSGPEKQALALLSQRTINIPSGATLYSQGAEISQLYLVKSGWLGGCCYSAHGAGGLFQIQLPGDVCGITDFGSRRRTHSLLALTDCEVCPLPCSCVAEFATTAPRLALVFSAVVALETRLQRERSISLVRLCGADRLLHFLLQMYHRQRLADWLRNDTVFLPINQSQLGDIIGLTNVSVSKAFCELEANRVVRRLCSSIQLFDIPALQKRVGFHDHYEELELSSWFDDVHRSVRLSADRRSGASPRAV